MTVCTWTGDLPPEAVSKVITAAPSAHSPRRSRTVRLAVGAINPDPRTDMDRVYNAIVLVETRDGRAVSRHEVREQLEAQGITVRSLDGLVWRLEMLNRIWANGYANQGRHGRRARVYTTKFRFTRPSNHVDLGKTVPSEVRRAVRAVATALRGAAEALSQLDELVDDAPGPRR